MANEIQASFSLAVNNGALIDSKQFSFQADQALARENKVVQSIPTTAAGTALTFSSGVTTLGTAYFINLDATNFVEVGVQVAGTFYPVARMKGGVVGKKEGAMFRLVPGVTYYARADTA